MTPFLMHGNLEPDERILYDHRPTWMEVLCSKLGELGWDPNDEIKVEVGGTVVSGIHQPPDANPKWTLPYGSRRFNKEAFIVIQNESRRETVGSQAFSDEELRERFLVDSSGQLYAKRELEELREPGGVVVPGAGEGMAATQGDNHPI